MTILCTALALLLIYVATEDTTTSETTATRFHVDLYPNGIEVITDSFTGCQYLDVHTTAITLMPNSCLNNQK